MEMYLVKESPNSTGVNKQNFLPAQDNSIKCNEAEKYDMQLKDNCNDGAKKTENLFLIEKDVDDISYDNEHTDNNNTHAQTLNTELNSQITGKFNTYVFLNDFEKN